MEFLIEIIHFAAIDYAREVNNKEIIEILSKSSVNASKEETEIA